MWLRREAGGEKYWRKSDFLKNTDFLWILIVLSTWVNKTLNNIDFSYDKH